MSAALLRGALAGLGATVAMSAIMLGARRLGLTPTLPYGAALATLWRVGGMGRRA